MIRPETRPMSDPLAGRVVCSEQDRIYFARRAAEEDKLAADAQDPQAAEAHRKMQRAYLERASSVSDRRSRTR